MHAQFAPVSVSLISLYGTANLNSSRVQLATEPFDGHFRLSLYNHFTVPILPSRWVDISAALASLPHSPLVVARRRARRHRLGEEERRATRRRALRRVSSLPRSVRRRRVWPRGQHNCRRDDRPCPGRCDFLWRDILINNTR